MRSKWASARREEGASLDRYVTDPAAAGLDLDAIFDYTAFTRHAPEIVGRLDDLDGVGEPT